MALDVRNIYSCDTTATAGNVNGGGFNPNNANMLTDLVTTNGTSSTPTVSSVTYAFIAGDVGQWVFVQKGTNWIPGFYQITSVAGGIATLNAAIGAAVIWQTASATLYVPYSTIYAGSGANQIGAWIPSTAQGCCTQATPGGNGTFSVDRSQSATAQQTTTTATNTAGVLTVGGLTYDKSWNGNVIQIVAGTGATQGWYEITNAVAGTSFTLDRDPSGTTNISINCGGAISLGSSTANRTDDDFFELGKGTNGTGSGIFFIKQGTFATTQSISISSVGGTQSPVQILGFASVRGDNPTSTTRPTLGLAANTWQFTGYDILMGLIFTGTGTGIILIGNSPGYFNCKFTNSSTTASRSCLAFSSSGFSLGTALACEFVCYRGNCIGNISNTPVAIIACYFHDSNQGISATLTSSFCVANCIFASMVTTHIILGTGVSVFGLTAINNTFYGAEAKLGVGISFGANESINTLLNNIFYGLTTAVTHATAAYYGGIDNYNNYYNNTTDVTNWTKGNNDKAVDPTFTSISQVTGTAGKYAAGNDRIIDTSKNFTSLGVVAGQDYIYIVSGTGVTAGIYGISSITTTTNPNDTLVLDIAPGTNTTADKVYQIPIYHNFAIGTNLKSLGFPGAFPASLSTGYLDIGAVQRQEVAGGLPLNVMGVI